MSHPEAKPTIEAAFKRSIQEMRAHQLMAVLVVAAPMPLRSLCMIDPGESRFAPGAEHWGDFLRAGEASWTGAAVWFLPPSFESELIESRGGALFSHSGSSDDEQGAFAQELGARGWQVGGLEWIRARKGAQMPVAVSRMDLGDGFNLRGERPAWWPQTMPMAERPWKAIMGPADAPDWGRAALLEARAKARSVQAALEEIFPGQPMPQELQKALSAQRPVGAPLGRIGQQIGQSLGDIQGEARETLDQELSQALALWEASQLKESLSPKKAGGPQKRAEPRL